MTKIMFVAGESSGDLLGADLIAALHARGEAFDIIGLGGPQMEKAGLHSIFPMSDLSVMGLAEVLPHLPQLIRRINETVALAEKEKPDLLITIDSPDFCLRVAKKVKQKTGIPCVHYVSPHVWAWRHGRVHKMAKYLDKVLALFPFEPKSYEGSGLECTFVGHPVVERFGSYLTDKPQEVAIPPKLALVPGSRHSELSRMLPTMALTVEELAEAHTGLKLIVPMADHFREADFAILKKLPVDISFVRGQARFAALQSADAAMATSGTVNLELAMLDVPMVVAYRMGRITHFLAKRLVKLRHFSPVNLAAQKRVVPELLQNEVTPTSLRHHISPLLTNTPERLTMLKNLADVRTKLGAEGEKPSLRAADAVLEILRR